VTGSASMSPIQSGAEAYALEKRCREGAIFGVKPPLNPEEPRRRLALASGFRLLRLSGINRLDEPAHGAGRGSIGPNG